MSTRSAQAFPEESILHCRSGTTAIKGNLHDAAEGSFRTALALNPMLWEAFEGLCDLGTSLWYVVCRVVIDIYPLSGQVPEIDELFPPRPLPVLPSTLSEDSFFTAGPVTTGAGLFAPDNGTNGNPFWPEIPFRIGPSGPRESM